MSSFVEWARAEQELARRLEAGVAALERKALLFDVSNYSNAIVKSARQAAPIVIGPEEFEASLEWLQRPVFICGHHRSGTTLLQELLDDHPQLAVLPVEVTYFASFADVAVDAFIAEWVARLIDVNGKLHFHLGRASHTHNPSFEFARALLAWHARLASDRRVPASLALLLALAAAYVRHTAGERTPLRWVEKTPLNERHFPRLGLLPEARFIQMVREPVATLRSQHADFSGAGIAFDVAEQSWRIGRSFRLARRNLQRAQDRYVVLRYEDLVADPQAQMERVRTFLGIPPAESLHRPTVRGEPVGSNSAFQRSAQGEIRMAAQAHGPGIANLRVLEAFTLTAAEFGYANPMHPIASAAVRLFHSFRLAPRHFLRRAHRALRIPRT